MNTVLMVVAALALALAAGMAIVIARLLREDRERSEARVATLRAAAGNLAAAEQPVARPREVAAPGTAPLFAPREEPSPWARRLAIAGALAFVLAAGGFAATRRPDAARPTAASAGQPVSTSGQAAAASTRPLELLALRHARQPEVLTISGIVQNPAAGAPVSRLVATAIVFGPNGVFLTSSRAPLDTSTLRPGEESPFEIAVPVQGDVARYRIGFRTEEGTVMAHVDKRTPEALASRQGQP